MNIFIDEKFYKGSFEIQNGIFSKVYIEGPEDEKDPDYVIPGLIDIHSHGRSGEDFSFLDEAALGKLLKSYANQGVTSVLATTMTNDPEVIERSIGVIGEASSREIRSGESRLLGIHMEGPFLGKDKKGAHDEQYLTDFDKKWLDKIIETSHNTVRIISVDPRLSDATGFIREYSKRGIVISLAHTGADYATAVSASEAGADHVTHLFNAMEPLLHRAPGVIGAAFDRKMYQEIICDGIHVNPTLLRMWFKLNPDRMVVISDSMQAAGLPEGVYSLGGLDVYVKDGKATLENGTIAGSTTDLLKEVRNLIEFGIDRNAAILAATLNPAKSIRMENVVGQIKTGGYADYLICDKNLELKDVYINGRNK